MNPSPAQPLPPDKEALGRAVIAEFEWRQLQQKRERRRRGWSFAMLIGWSLLVLGAAVFVRDRNIPITTYDLCWWFAIMAATGAAVQYGHRDEFRKLRAEVEELKQALREMNEKRESEQSR